MRQTKLSIFYFCALLLLLWGCATTSNQAKFGKQEFNDLVSHDNAWFNCNDKMNSTMALALQYHKDKFDSVLPVYFYTDPKEFASYSSDLDDIIKRTTVAIQLHNIANWTDDNFLLIGEAQFLKGDYDKAYNTFKYITTQFKEGVDYVKVMRQLGKKVGKYVPAKKRPPKPQVQVVVNKDGTQTLEKLDNRPEISMWIHTPARSEALVWLIKTYTRQKKYEQANTVITYTRNDNLFYKDYDKDLDLAEADLRVSQKKYGAAIAPLEAYLADKKVVHHKKLKVRPLFVLAQCYAATGNVSKAIENYTKVLKSHPNYDMEFYAKLKMAKLGRDGSEDPAAMRSLLAKMAKDSKYKDYWDQVYYELALLSLAEHNKNEAMNLLHQSVSYSTKNEDQKATSYLKIAQLDYDDQLFVPAKFYYDSTLSLLAKSDTRYPEVQERDKMLANLVKQLAIIAQEDSLQQLAALSPEEQLKAVRDAIAEKERAAAEKKAQESQQKMQQQLVGLPGSNQQNQSQAGNWYFYNETTKSAGYNEFVKRWGKRTLEENWRRSNKNQAEAEEDTTEVDTATAKKDTLKGTEEERLLAGIPNDSAARAKSIERAVNAYYTAGTIYKDGLESYENAWYMFATLNDKYPNHKLLLESYYNLYLIAQKLKQDDNMQKYKDLILKQFPESVIAKILRDPNYVNEAKKEENAADTYYQSAFDDYSTGRLDSAWYKCEMSDVVLKPNPLSARFQLLGALVLAKENRLTDYLQVLNKIINKSGDAEIKKTATEMLALLNKSKLKQVDLSRDPAMRDSLNEKYKLREPIVTGPDTSSENDELIKKLNAAKQAAIKSGKYKPDTSNTATAMVTKAAGKDNAPTTSAAGNTSSTKDTGTASAAAGGKATGANPKKAPADMQEDTASPYKRTDNDIHYVIVYINDTVSNSAFMSTMALINAYNSTQANYKGLATQTKLINASNKVLRITKFKNRDEAMPYYKILKAQTQLFGSLKPYKYSISVISDTNYKTLFNLENIDDYNKYFKRVYLGR